MGWRSVLRSMERAARQANRDSLKRQKQADKAQLMAFSANAVTDVDEHIRNIISIHCSAIPLIDWGDLEANSRPFLSTKYADGVNSSAHAVAVFKPSIFDRFLGRTKSRLARLKQLHKSAVQAAEIAEQKFREELSAWSNHFISVDRAAKGESTALKKLLENIKYLSSDSRIGRSISFEIKENFIHAKPIVHNSDMVPRVRLKQLASGRLSESKLPDARFHEIYQDYVCSVAFRIGAELFNTVPLQEVFVTCHTDMLNSATGYVEETAILSVKFVRTTFEKLNLHNIDPSDALKNFNHKIQFKRSKGFERIEPL